MSIYKISNLLLYSTIWCMLNNYFFSKYNFLVLSLLSIFDIFNCLISNLPIFDRSIFKKITSDLISD